MFPTLVRFGNKKKGGNTYRSKKTSSQMIIQLQKPREVGLFLFKKFRCDKHPRLSLK